MQGHPKLLELAEVQADDPEALEEALENAANVWGKENRLASFFEYGESSQKKADKFLEVLKNWTRSVSANLPEASRTLFRFLCTLEEPDRRSWIVEQVWPNLWIRLGLSGQAPSIDKALQDLKALADVQTTGDGFTYIILPVVAEACLVEQKQDFRAAVNEEMAVFWRTLIGEALDKEMEGAGEGITSAGLRGSAYLMKMGRWEEAIFFLDQAVARDSTLSAAYSVLPLLRHVDHVMSGTGIGRHAAILLNMGFRIAGRWREAEIGLGILLSECVEQNDFHLALKAAAELFIILRDNGRSKEALALVEDMKDYTNKAGLGPWTQLSNEVNRLQALNKLGQYFVVLEAAKSLKKQMASISETSMENESVLPWNVKKNILDSEMAASVMLHDYKQALELNAEILKVEEARGASESEVAFCAFNSYFSLLKLGMCDQARDTLLCCKEVFEREKDIKMLGMVFSALAHLEFELGDFYRAIKFEGAALRYKYLTDDADLISTSHHNMATYFSKDRFEKALAHRLAAGIIRYMTDSCYLASNLQNLSLDLARFGPLYLPASFDQLCSIVEEIEGVNFKDLFTQLAGPCKDGDSVMQEMLRMAQKLI